MTCYNPGFLKKPGFSLLYFRPYMPNAVFSDITYFLVKTSTLDLGIQK